MQLMKFEADDMRDGLTKVKEAMGPDALIVATRHIKQPGLFGKTRLEVTAALEEEGPAALPAKSPGLPGVDQATLEKRLAPLREELRSLRRVLRSDNGEEREALRKEIEALRGLLTSPEPGVDEREHWCTRALIAADLDPGFATELAREAQRSSKDAELTGMLQQAIARRIKVWSPPKFGRRIVALVGPTGVGKTTTIAKLAAQHSLIRGDRVALLTTDTYRVGAVDQLQQYADIIGLPLHVVHDPEGFQAAVDANSDADVILVDTAGRNPGDNDQVPSLLKMFGEIGVQVLLTLVANTRQLEINRILDRYLPLRLRGLVVTKLDEAESFAGILNASLPRTLPLAWVARGQRVPEDLARPDPESLATEIVSQALRISGLARFVSSTNPTPESGEQS